MPANPKPGAPATLGKRRGNKLNTWNYLRHTELDITYNFYRSKVDEFRFPVLLSFWSTSFCPCICATHASFNLQVIPVDKAKRKMVASRKAVHRKRRRRGRKPTPTLPGHKKKEKKQAVALATYVAWQWQLDNATDNVPLYMTGQRVFGWNFCAAFLISNFWAFRRATLCSQPKFLAYPGLIL